MDHSAVGSRENRTVNYPHIDTRKRPRKRNTANTGIRGFRSRGHGPWSWHSTKPAKQASRKARADELLLLLLEVEMQEFRAGRIAFESDSGSQILLHQDFPTVLGVQHMRECFVFGMQLEISRAELKEPDSGAESIEDLLDKL